MAEMSPIPDCPSCHGRGWVVETQEAVVGDRVYDDALGAVAWRPHVRERLLTFECPCCDPMIGVPVVDVE